MMEDVREDETEVPAADSESAPKSDVEAVAGSEEMDDSEAVTSEASEVDTAADETAAADTEGSGEQADAVPANPRLAWYVAHTYSGHEQKAKRHLESAIDTGGFGDRFGRVIVPTEQVTEMRQGKKSTSTRKFLPSYLLVEMELDNETRHLVVNTPGITNFVGAGGKPQALAPEEVQHIIGHMEKGPVLKTDEVPYSAGDAVKVTDGPFADFSGVVSEVIPERKKLKVMVSIFGRPTPVELDYLQVQPA